MVQVGDQRSLTTFANLARYWKFRPATDVREPLGRRSPLLDRT
jgi:hypothetical protein